MGRRNSASDAVTDTTPGPDDAQTWATFEAEALPHADRLFRVAMWFERNRQEAEDLVQDTMTQALRSFHRYQPGTNCCAWLMTILHRRAEQPPPGTGPVARTERRGRRRRRGCLLRAARPPATHRRRGARGPATPARGLAGSHRALRRGRAEVPGDRRRPRHSARHGDVAPAPRPRAPAPGADRYRVESDADRGRS